MYYEDMSAYSFYLPFALSEVKNIGWLDAEHDFRKGAVDSEILDKLYRLIIKSELINTNVNVSRGVHSCNVCGNENIILSTAEKTILGRSEIWMPSGQEGQFFAAPSMVYHYIKDHHYLPPPEFISAIDCFAFESPFYAQEVYLGLVKKHGYPK